MLRILVLRRDNIGDLVCTTPVFRALREHYPEAYIVALVNSYTRPVLENNPDIDRVYAYTKAKHRAHGASIFSIYWERASLVFRLRRMRFEYVILASPEFAPRVLRLARLIRPQHIIGFKDSSTRGAKHIDMSVDRRLPRTVHESEDVFQLLGPLGIYGRPPCARVFAQSNEIAVISRMVCDRGLSSSVLLVAVHISARKPSQRWPEQHFVDFLSRLHKKNNARFILLWSPGDEKNPLHPGDDAKAKKIVDALAGVPVLAYPTHQLAQLIAALSLCGSVVCSDGGAMHLAAALDKKILCFFGDSDAVRWRPWGVPHVLLQPPTRDVADISVEEAEEGFQRLLSL